MTAIETLNKPIRKRWCRSINIVIYPRYSSLSQTEQSIGGKLQTCYEFAKRNGHLVTEEYVDRAQSGTTDSRADLQHMIADGDRRTFEAALVYQFDRFARNRYDNAINKAKLKKNGIRVISAKENISEDASGILMGSVVVRALLVDLSIFLMEPPTSYPYIF